MSFQLYLDKILTRTPKSLTFTCMTKTERIDGAKFFIFNNQNFLFKARVHLFYGTCPGNCFCA